MNKAEQIKQVELRLGRERRRRNIARMTEAGWKEVKWHKNKVKGIEGL